MAKTPEKKRRRSWNLRLLPPGTLQASEMGGNQRGRLRRPIFYFYQEGLTTAQASSTSTWHFALLECFLIDLPSPLTIFKKGKIMAPTNRKGRLSKI